MMATTDMVVSMKMGLANVMKQTYDADAVLRKPRFQFLKFFIHAKRMNSQSSGEPVMRIASCPEEVAVFQVPYNPIHPRAINFPQQRQDFRSCIIY